MNEGERIRHLESAELLTAAPTVNLSVASANAIGTSNYLARSDHSHAITSSANPGATASILATTAAGCLQLLRLGIGVGCTNDNQIAMADGASIGIPGAELLTFNAAGTAVFSGCTLTLSTVQASMLLTSTTGTNPAYHLYRNTGGDMYFGRNRSVAGGLAPGALAYAGVWTVEGAHAAQIATNGAVRLTVDSGGDVGIGIAAGIAAKCHIDQSVDDDVIPVLILDQADLSEEFINLICASTGAGDPVDTATAVGTTYARLRVAVNGTFKYIQLHNA